MIRQSQHVPPEIRWLRAGPEGPRPMQAVLGQPFPAVSVESSMRSTLRLPLGLGWAAEIAVVPYIEDGQPVVAVSSAVVGVEPGADPRQRAAVVDWLLGEARSFADAKERARKAVAILRENVDHPTGGASSDLAKGRLEGAELIAELFEVMTGPDGRARVPS